MVYGSDEDLQQVSIAGSHPTSGDSFNISPNSPVSYLIRSQDIKSSVSIVFKDTNCNFQCEWQFIRDDGIDGDAPIASMTNSPFCKVSYNSNTTDYDLIDTCNRSSPR